MKNLARFYCILIADKCRKRFFNINIFRIKKEPVNAKNIANQQALLSINYLLQKR